MFTLLCTRPGLLFMAKLEPIKHPIPCYHQLLATTIVLSVSMKLDTSGDLMGAESSSVCLLVTGFFRLA